MAAAGPDFTMAVPGWLAHFLWDTFLEKKIWNTFLVHFLLGEFFGYTFWDTFFYTFLGHRLCQRGGTFSSGAES